MTNLKKPSSTQRGLPRSNKVPTTGSSEGRDPALYLDRLTRSRKEGWQEYVEASRPESPERLTVRQIHALSPEAFAEYNQRRAYWHANFGMIQTDEVTNVTRQISLFVESNCQRYGLKPALALSGLPGLGKTEVVNSYAKAFHRDRIHRYGEVTESGSERLPVCRVGMTGITGVKEFVRAVLNFYAHPARGTTGIFFDQVQDLIMECGTELMLIDDLHFLRGRYPAVTDLSNQFKYMADNFGVTMLFVGIGLNQRAALLDDDGSYQDHAMDQLLRLAKPVTMVEYTLKPAARQKDWLNLLLTLEQLLVLARSRPGMLIELSDYLHARSGGHIGSLMTLLRLGCQYAIDTGSERITKSLLDTFKIDSAAELGRRQLMGKRCNNGGG